MLGAKRYRDKFGHRNPHRREDVPKQSAPGEVKRYTLSPEEIEERYGAVGENATAAPIDVYFTSKEPDRNDEYYKKMKKEFMDGGMDEEDADLAITEIAKIRYEERKEKKREQAKGRKSLHCRSDNKQTKGGGNKGVRGGGKTPGKSRRDSV